MDRFQIERMISELSTLQSNFHLLKTQNEYLENLNEANQTKIKNQSKNLAEAQNSLRIKNELIKEITEKMIILKVNAEKQRENQMTQNAVTANLRKRIGDLETKITNDDVNRYAFLGKIRRLEDAVSACKIENANMRKIFEMEQTRTNEEYGNKINELNDEIRELNDRFKKNIDADRSSKQIDEDLWRTCSEQLKYIESLKTKNEENLMKMREVSLKQNETMKEWSKTKEQLKQIEAEKNSLIEQLNILKTRNRNDLEDTTCLICTTEMKTEEHDYDSLPKCNKCKRRYHIDCISQ
uniref:RING-type domain-containing protein n=1 Tax=Caenorhabditis tropicalis TaxID=1561998 RepID=A0A1I7T476_9PELO